MARIGRRWRLGLVLSYVVATAWAQGGHRHHDPARDEVRCRPSCDDAREHLSSHPSPDLGRDRDDCPACQLRTSLIAPLDPTPSLDAPCVQAASVVEPACLPSRPLLRPTSRGPPLA